MINKCKHKIAESILRTYRIHMSNFYCITICSYYFQRTYFSMSLPVCTTYEKRLSLTISVYYGKPNEFIACRFTFYLKIVKWYSDADTCTNNIIKMKFGKHLIKNESHTLYKLLIIFGIIFGKRNIMYNNIKRLIFKLYRKVFL